jgi:hypothetical protein
MPQVDPTAAAPSLGGQENWLAWACRPVAYLRHPGGPDEAGRFDGWPGRLIVDGGERRARRLLRESNEHFAHPSGGARFAQLEASMNSELDGCVVSFEQTKEELEHLERVLAQRHHLAAGRTLRATLIAMDMVGGLGDDEVVADWRAAHTSFLDWAHAQPPEVPKRSRAGEGRQKEAAEAASALLCPGLRKASSRVSEDGHPPETASIPRTLFPGSCCGHRLSRRA